MDRITTIRAAFAALGIATWGWGYNHDQPKVRVAGMAFMAVALVLRWVARRRADQSTSQDAAQ